MGDFAADRPLGGAGHIWGFDKAQVSCKWSPLHSPGGAWLIWAVQCSSQQSHSLAGLSRLPLRVWRCLIWWWSVLYYIHMCTALFSTIEQTQCAFVACDSNWVTVAFCGAFWIVTQVVYWQRCFGVTWLVPRETAVVSAYSVYAIQLCAMSRHTHAKPHT